MVNLEGKESEKKFEISDEALDKVYEILVPIAVRILKEERKRGHTKA